MHEIFKKLASPLRSNAFRGSGQNFRKTEGDFILVVNFQISRTGSSFFINLGAQPVFIPAEGNADPNKLKEYECVLRRRVGGEYPLEMPNGQLKELEEYLILTMKDFFGHAQTIRSAIASDPPEALLQDFSSGNTLARAALHIARACLALGYCEKASSIANLGLEQASEKAIILKTELNSIITEGKAQP